MSEGETDNPGIKVPPPLIYLLPLLLGLILDRKAHLPFLPSGVARVIGWPLIGCGALIGSWWRKTMRNADAPVRTDRPVPRLTTAGPFGYSRNPAYLSGHDLRRDSCPEERFVGHPLPTVSAVCDPARGDRTGRAVSGAHLRGGIPGL
jgi:hypothetical protein